MAGAAWAEVVETRGTVAVEVVEAAAAVMMGDDGGGGGKGCGLDGSAVGKGDGKDGKGGVQTVFLKATTLRTHRVHSTPCPDESMA